MRKTELARRIFDEYYHTFGRIVRVFLNDHTILDGVFVGYFYDELDEKPDVPDRWHFIPENCLEQYRNAFEYSEVFGKIIKQDEIVSVEFREIAA